MSKKQQEIVPITPTNLQGSERQVEEQHHDLLQQVDQLREKQKGILAPLLMSTEEKSTVETYNKHQREAIDAVLSSRNQGIRAVAKAQAAFISEICQSALVKERSSMQVDAAIHYQAESIRLQRLLEHFSQDFYNLIEEKLANAEQRPALIRQQIEVDTSKIVLKWSERTLFILNKFDDLIKNSSQ